MTPEQKTLYFDVMGELYEDVTFLGKESSFPLYSNWAICYILSSWKMHTCESVPVSQQWVGSQLDGVRGEGRQIQITWRAFYKYTSFS